VFGYPDACPTVTIVPSKPPGGSPVAPPIEVGLNAVIVAVTDETPRILTIRPELSAERAASAVESLDYLPSGSLDSIADRTLELGLRRWVREQTGLDLGYIEQLYTFGDRDHDADGRRRLLSIAYLALARQVEVFGQGSPAWRPIYAYLPWEDWRSGRPGVIDAFIAPGLAEWSTAGSSPAVQTSRRDRVEIAFGLGAMTWDPNRVLTRYELLYAARLVAEARPSAEAMHLETASGRPMSLDHRRIVAASLERLRGKLSYRPVVFELLPEAFTLLALQRVVEALSGLMLHKSNFRRLVEQAQLVERTGELDAPPRGRPAELFRFRREVLRERPAPGVTLPRRFPR
jgi:hypothetical protein